MYYLKNSIKLVKGELKPDEQPNHLGKLTVFSGIWQYPARVKCASLGWHTMHGALEKPKPFPRNKICHAITDTFNRPLRDLRISLIDRCNFRCPYCMPSEKYHHAYEFLDKKQWLSFEEIERLARIFVGLGVTKLRLTGGEPLLRPELDVLIRQLSAIPGVEDLALTTNGSMLAPWAQRLKAAGLAPFDSKPGYFR